MIVTAKPATVRGWWLKRWNIFWGEISKGTPTGRPPVDQEIIVLIRQMANDNSAWGVPRIQGELRMLEYNVACATIRKYMPKRSTTPEQRQRWRTFIRNHLDVTVAMDFFAVKMARNGDQLYVWFLIHQGTREILHWNVTAHPTSAWVCQQIREACPGDRPLPKFLICDRDSIFGNQVRQTITNMGIEPKRTSFREFLTRTPGHRSLRCLPFRRIALDRDRDLGPTPCQCHSTGHADPLRTAVPGTMTEPSIPLTLAAVWTFHGFYSKKSAPAKTEAMPDADV